MRIPGEKNWPIVMILVEVASRDHNSSILEF